MATPWIEDTPYDPSFPVWTRAWIQEMSPGPVAPLNWDLFWSGPLAEGWRDLLVDRMGFAPGQGTDPAPRLVGVFNGHLYLNASVLRVWSDRVPALAPEHIDSAYLLGTEEMPVHTPARWQRPPGGSEALLSNWLSWVLAEQNQRELEAGRVLSLEAASTRPPLGQLSDGELVERALSLQPLCRVLASQHLNQALAASIGPGVIAAVCAQLGRIADAPALLGGLGDIESVAPTRVLWAMSRQVRASSVLNDLFDAGLDDLDRRLRASDAIEVVGFLAGFDALLSEVGFRGGDDWDICTRSWRMEPRSALAAIDRIRDHPDDTDPAPALARTAAQREELAASILEAIGDDTVTRDQVTAAMSATRIFLRGRDRAKSNVTRVLNEMRAAVRELAGRAADRGDVAEWSHIGMLFADELVYYADGGLADIRTITDARRAHFDEVARVPPVALIRSIPEVRRVRPVEPLAKALEVGESLLGRPASAGVGRGRCRIVTSTSDASRAQPGEIVVAASTSPSWTPFLVGAAGVIIEHGSGLSHVVVAARELGLPVIVAARRVQDRLKDGSLVEIDGTTGMVSVLDELVASPDESLEVSLDVSLEVSLDVTPVPPATPAPVATPAPAATADGADDQ